MIALVGYTGFVGSNIAKKADPDGLYNSKNIGEAFGTRPDILIYAGLSAEKFIAAKFPEKDLEAVNEAFDNIRKIEAKKTVLISTVEVYRDPFMVTEDDGAEGKDAYGINRALLEEKVRTQIKDHLIIRLPGLFGKGIKKNFIYDYINYIPSLLSESKFEELSKREPLLKENYRLNEKGFYRCEAVSSGDRKALREAFEKLGFSAMNFTDNRGKFQYYNLEHLYDDIMKAVGSKLEVLNIAAEPVFVSEIYRYLTGDDFRNELDADVPSYDMRTRHYKCFGGKAAATGPGGYMYSREQTLEEIRIFTDKEKQE